MITIKGTNKIKGALDLSGINKQLKAGDALPISDEEFNDHTVQVALSMGFLKYDKGNTIEMPNETSVNVKNIYDRPILINCLNDEIRVGQVFTLTAAQVNSSDIRGALAKGFIEIISSARPSSDIDESEVRVGNLFEVKNMEPAEETEKTEYLETNEEVSDPGIIDTENPDPINNDDIPDAKGESIIWNPNRDPITHTASTMKSKSAKKAAQADETNVELGDISFVDADLDEKRRQSHPILKDKPQKDDDGIDFL